MLCYRCGSHVQDGADKCWNCGAQLAGTATGGIPSLDELRQRQKTRSRMSGVVHKIGDVIGGRHKVLDILGTGGAGVVYRAHDQEIDVDVAVKVINAKLVQTAEEKRLFAREIKVARKLSHQNIVRIFDEGTDGERVFTTMQYLDGLPLRKIVDLRRSKDQQFSLAEIEPLLNQLCQALDYAHKTGLHGNLKPDNIIILPDLLKITDFGMLKGLPRKPFMAIQKSRKVNFHYYAPEIRNEVREINKQVDIYSLGVVLWEMLTGVVYEDGRTETLEAPNVDAKITRIIKRCLARSPKDRFKTAGALYSALRDVMASSGIPPVDLASGLAEVRQTSKRPRTGPPPPPESSGLTPSQRPPVTGEFANEGTGNYEAIDDEMIESSAVGGQSEQIVASEIEIPPLADGASEIGQRTPSEEPEELNDSEVELINDPKATNVLEMSEDQLDEMRQLADPEILSDDVEAAPTAESREGLIDEDQLQDYSEDDEDEATEAWSGGVPPELVDRSSEASTGDEQAKDPTENPSVRPTEGPTEAARMPPESDPEITREGALADYEPNVTDDLPAMAGEKTPHVPTSRPPGMGRPKMSRAPGGPKGRVAAPGTTGRKAKARPATRPRMAAIRQPTHGFNEFGSSGSIPAPMPPSAMKETKTNPLVYMGAGFLVLFVAMFFMMWQQNQKQIEALTSKLEQVSKRENVALESVKVEEKKAENARIEIEKAVAAEAEAQAAAKAESERKAKAEAEAKAAAEAESRARSEEAAVAARTLKEEKRREAAEAAEAEKMALNRSQREAARREKQEAARQRAEQRTEREREEARRLAEERKRLQEERRARMDDKKRERAEARRIKAEEAREAAEERRRANAEARERAAEKKRKAAEEKKAAAEEKAAAVVSTGGEKCPRGMALVKAGAFRQGSASNDPERNFGDLSIKQVDVSSFCVDYYEYPNGRNRTPSSRVSYNSAVKKCKRRGKRLCSEQEWEKACAGPRNIRYPYGNQWNAELCGTEDEDGNDRTVKKIATYKKCKSGFSAYDMAGNVAEWTSTSWGSGMVVKGGAADRPGYDSRCAARKKKKKKYSSEMLGFRCCADPK